jgi:hypothetical protein
MREEALVHFVESNKSKRLNEEREGDIETQRRACYNNGSSLRQKSGFSENGCRGNIKVPVKKGEKR